MKFSGKLIVNEQPAADINRAQSNTLSAFTLGGDMVYLNISGFPAATNRRGDVGIATILTTDECLELIRMLQAACEASGGQVACLMPSLEAPRDAA